MSQTTAALRGASPDPLQFKIDRTYPGRWTITFNNPPINVFVPTTIVELRALMTDLEADPSDREALAAAKAQINRFGIPKAAELQSSNDMIFPMNIYSCLV